MKTAILNQLNAIRALERKKLLELTRKFLNASGNTKARQLPDDILPYFDRLAREIEYDKNYSRSLANFTKLGNLISALNQNDTAPQGGNTGLNITEEINRKIETFLPEQPGIRPLAPFIFHNKNVTAEEVLISVFILNENGAEHLNSLFSSFLNFTSFTSYKIIFYDRASTDKSLEIAYSFKDKLPLEITAFNRKLTKSYLLNSAVDACTSKYLLFLDKTASFKSDILTRFLEIYTESPSVAILGPNLTIKGSVDKTEEQTNYGGIKFSITDISGVPDIPFPTIDPAFLVKSGLDTKVKNYRKEDAVFVPPGLSTACLKPQTVRHGPGTDEQIVPSVTGHAMFCSRADFISAGGFDLNFIDGFEDIDLCMKLSINLKKEILLTHKIEINLNIGDISARYGGPDKTTYNYNLGTLINKQGWYIKNKYFSDLNKNKKLWTNDNVDKIATSALAVNLLRHAMNDGPADLKDAEQLKKITIDYLNGIRDKKFRIAIKTSAFNDERTLLWGDYHYAHSLKRAFLKKGHRARVDLHENWYDNGYLFDDVVIVLRGTKRYHVRGGQINILWNISHPEQITEDEYRDYDYVFSASNTYPDELMEKFNIHAESLLQCTDAGLFHPGDKDIKDEEKTDILFVGNSRGIMRKSIHFSLQKNIPVAVYGSKWESFLPQDMIKGIYVKNEELRKYYSGCKILLNDHWDDMVECGFISNRLFDALACGAIVLSDRVNGIEKTFENGVFYYRDANEFEEQIRWIRENYEEAKQLALKNSEGILKKHTFDHRAVKILEVANDLYRKKLNPEPAGSTGKSSLFGRMIGFIKKKKTS
jgi:glycosyltransferase involved in cell wall biosynthesis/GT2 family glycosyltransferase